MKRNIIIAMTVLLLISTMSITVMATSVESVDSKWVYDDTDSISNSTIEYIDELNNSTLKENQYAVYVTKTLPVNMDEFKLGLFNEYGIGNKEVNSGILFVLATEDREYGIEVGDGLTGQARAELNKDFVPNVSLSELKNGDWDKAVYKVSQHISEVISTPIVEGVGPDTSDEEPIRPGIFILSIFIAIVIIGTPITTIMFLINFFSEEQRFFRTDKFNQYVTNNTLNKKDVKSEFIYENYDLDSYGIYSHLVSKVAEDLMSNKSIKLSKSKIESIYDYEDFMSRHNSAIIKLVSKEVFKRNQEIEAKKEAERKKVEQELQKARELNKQWFYDDFVDYKLHTKDIIDKIAVIIESSTELMTTKELAIEWFEMNYRAIVVENKVDEMFSDLDSNRRSIILDGLRGTEEYRNYISGIRDTFTPSESVSKESVYYDESIINNNLIQNNKLNSRSSNPWFWLWVFGNNYNAVSLRREETRRQEQAMAAERARIRREESQKKSSSNSNTFGSGFGGGFSSGGGGFSGKF